jgi:hypothetical protein
MSDTTAKNGSCDQFRPVEFLKLPPEKRDCACEISLAKIADAITLNTNPTGDSQKVVTSIAKFKFEKGCFAAYPAGFRSYSIGKHLTGDTWIPDTALMAKMSLLRARKL